jgi:hypothetical protein
MIVAWLCPHRFPHWREVYARTAADADLLLVRVQRGNPIGLKAADVPHLFRGRRVVTFETSKPWTSSSWRQEFCDKTRELESTANGSQLTILQFDEDEALSSEQVRADAALIEGGARSVWYRFQGPLPAADGAFDGFPASVTYPAAPHCKVWRWFPGASFTVPRYQGYASPCGFPKQPDKRLHVMSENRIKHLLLATPELRKGRPIDFAKYQRRANRRVTTTRQAPHFETWLTTLVGD